MNTLDAIAARRSIRKFKADPVPDEVLRCILMAGIQAPSGKNRQPWRFVVVQGEKKDEMLRVMREGIAQVKGQGDSVGSSEVTAEIMEQAPVTIIVINPDGLPPSEEHSFTQMVWDVIDIQSVGAAIENMLLAALDFGLGTLWIGDTFFAYQELMEWLGEKGEMIAAVAVGYTDEQPIARPRKSIEDVVRWVGVAR